MGTFKVNFQIGNLQGQQYEAVEGLVDTGASDTVVPRPLLEKLGVAVEGSWPFTLADARVVEYDIGQASIQIGDTSRIVLVVFGEPDGPALLGASTLEVFHLAVDTVHQRLTPVTGLLM